MHTAGKKEENRERGMGEQRESEGVTHSLRRMRERSGGREGAEEGSLDSKVTNSNSVAKVYSIHNDVHGPMWHQGTSTMQL